MNIKDEITLYGPLRLNGDDETVGAHVLGEGHGHCSNVRANVEDCAAAGHEVLHDACSVCVSRDKGQG